MYVVGGRVRWGVMLSVVQMEDVKSILVASERLFGCGSDPSEMMRQTRIVTEVCFFLFCSVSCNSLYIPALHVAVHLRHWFGDRKGVRIVKFPASAIPKSLLLEHQSNAVIAIAIQLWCDYDTTTIQLRSDYDVLHVPTSSSAQAKNERQFFIVVECVVVL